jgi:transposase
MDIVCSPPASPWPEPGAVGIDIAKAKFDCALLQNGKFKSKVFANNVEGFAAFVAWLDTHNARALPVCMEATGSYGEALALHLADLKLKVSVVNPHFIAKYALAIGQRNKTDRQDARLIARYCSKEQPAFWQAPSLELRTLRDLVRRLEALQNLQQQERNRLALASEITRDSIEAVLGVLDEEAARIVKAISDHIDRNPDLRDRAKLLDSIPGEGDATLRMVLAKIPEAVLKDVRVADASTGLAPTRHESGSSVHARSHLSKRGSARVRKALFTPAVVAAQHNAVVKVFYLRMLKNGLTKMQAVCACMRKLLHIIIGVLKSGKPFDASMHKLV